MLHASLNHDIDDEEREVDDDEMLTKITSLLPQRAQNPRHALGRYIRSCNRWVWSFFSHRLWQQLLAPFGIRSLMWLLGARCSVLCLGLVPALHRAFFARDEDGGIFHA